MANDNDYPTNLLRSVLANVYFHSQMHVAKEMFQKSYFALGLAEKVAVDQAVLGHVALNYNALTPDFYGQASRQQAGFGTVHPDQSGPLSAAPDNTKTG